MSGVITNTNTITTTQSVPVSTQACADCDIQIIGTWTGTIVFEGTVDGTDWVAVSATPVGGGAAVTSATANGMWNIKCGGMAQVRARGNTVATGTATVWLQASAG